MSPNGFLNMLASEHGVFTWVTGIFSASVVYWITKAIYNIYFHPLASFPGPPLFTFSQIVPSYYAICGTPQYKVKEFHTIYGPVVRTSPNSLSYAHPDAWTDIFAKKLPKDPRIGVKTKVAGLVQAQEESDHARMRRNLSHGFSVKALGEQEELLRPYLDLFIAKLKEHSKEGPLDIVNWANFVTSDVIGLLTFGRSFDCLESGVLHSWMQNMYNVFPAFVILGRLGRFWPMKYIIKGLQLLTASKAALHKKFVGDRLATRLASGSSGTDFMTYVSRHTGTPTGMSIEELQETCASLILGGSETTSTALCGTIFNLTRNPKVLAQLQDEVRCAFRSAEEITVTSTNNLKYLHAVLTEALRIFSIVPTTVPRVTPPKGAQICKQYVPPWTTVSMSMLSAYHSPLNFHEPLAFRPERWLPRSPGTSVFQNDNRRIFQPFGVGPRNCIGSNLAWAELRMLLSLLIWNFDVELVAEESRGWIEGNFRCWAVYRKTPLVVRLTEVRR